MTEEHLSAAHAEAALSTSPGSNRLADEPSPYLRQHAHNPVDWYPWREEALARAKDEDKPIFLSIGYAACHWCHVMERESFEDATTAALLNAHFVPIKVDREERPDLDLVYLSAVQAMTGSGGWPLSVFLTPDLEPFFGGTYFPPEARWGMPSFRDVLGAVSDAWQRRRQELEGNATSVTAHLAEISNRDGAADMDLEWVSRAAVAALAAEHDELQGGFGRVPKFPSPSRLFFLLNRARKNDKARSMLTRTLDSMAAGGMYDWLGGGFHRYSVDRDWLVPHFEKMLYDNALLALAYGQAGVAFGRDEWVEVARATADYLLREMRGPEGAFFSSTDADSEGHEGLFFTWTLDQVREALPAELAALTIAYFALGQKGNFEGAASVLRPARPFAEVAAELGLDPPAAAEGLAEARKLLLTARARRSHPATDDKRLAGWNGMAVASLAWLGAALPESRYLDAARQAATFLLDQVRPDGRMVRSWREGVISGVETLEDLAWVGAGLLQLYEADGDLRWLAAAKGLIARRLPHYQGASGVLYDTPDDGPALIMRPRNPTDGATPSPAGEMAATLVRLAAVTGDEGLRATAERALRAEAAVVARIPAMTTTLLQAFEAASRPPVTLVVVGDPRWDSTRKMLTVARRDKPPGCALALSPSVPVSAELVREVPLFAGREAVGDGRARAYLCEGGVCLLPIEDPEALSRALFDLPI
ncbi:MAG TPA: thioredoxin domain-containing protein [Thermoanaerobaculaceae bacterium]|nr:thioredoxin domain-containing protein [Thermoanaerobaculaceae bacterium]